jgi:hypothetical protein
MTFSEHVEKRQEQLTRELTEAIFPGPQQTTPSSTHKPE